MHRNSRDGPTLPMINLNIPPDPTHRNFKSKSRYYDNFEMAVGLGTSLVNESSCESSNSVSSVRQASTSSIAASYHIPQFIKDKYGKVGIKISKPLCVVTKTKQEQNLERKCIRAKRINIKETDKKSQLQRFIERKMKMWEMNEDKEQKCMEMKSFDDLDKKKRIKQEVKPQNSFEEYSKIVKKNKISSLKSSLIKPINKSDLKMIHDFPLFKMPAILASPKYERGSDMNRSFKTPVPSKSSPLGCSFVVSGLNLHK